MKKIIQIVTLVILSILTIFLVNAFSLLKPLSSNSLDFYLLLIMVQSLIIYSVHLLKPRKSLIIAQILIIFITYVILKIIGMDNRINNTIVFVLYSVLLASSYHFLDYQIFIVKRFPYLRIFSFTLFGSIFFTLVQMFIHPLINQPLNTSIILAYLVNFIQIFIYVAICRVIHIYCSVWISNLFENNRKLSS